MAVVGSLSVELRAKVAKFLAGMQKSQTAAAQTAEGLRKLSGVATKAALSTAALSGVIAKFTADFEQSLTKAAAIAGKNQKGFQKAFDAMGKSALELSQSTKFTAREVTEGMTFMAMAGNDAAKTIGAMPAVLQLAAASGRGLGEAADTVTNIMAGFQKGTHELADANNVLIGTFTNSNVSLSELGESFKSAGPVAKSLKVPFEQVSAAIGLLGNAGIKGSEAGTGLKRAMTAIIGGSPQAKKAMETLGISAKTLTEQGLPGVIKNLEASSIGFDRAGKTAEFAELLFQAFGERAGPKMAALIGQGSEALEKLMAEIEVAKDTNIAAFLEEKQLATMSGQFDLLKSNVEAVAISIGEQLAPMLRPFVKGLRDAFQAFNNLSPGMKKFIAVGLVTTTVVGGLTAAVAAGLAILPAFAAGYGMLAAGLSATGLTISGVLMPALAAVTVALGAYHITAMAVEGITGKNVSITDAWSDALSTMAERADGIDVVLRNLVATIGSLLASLTGLNALSEALGFKGINKGLEDWAAAGSDAGMAANNLSEQQRELLDETSKLSKARAELVEIEQRMFKRKRAQEERTVMAKIQGTAAPVVSEMDRYNELVDSNRLAKKKEEIAEIEKRRSAFLKALGRQQKENLENTKKEEEAANRKNKIDEGLAAAAEKKAKALELAAKTAEEERKRKQRAKALAAAKERIAFEIELEGAGAGEKKIFDLEVLKKEFPEMAGLLGERAKQILSNLDAEQLPLALERAVESGLVSEDAAMGIAEEMRKSLKYAQEIEESLKPKPNFFEDLLNKGFSGVFDKLGIGQGARAGLQQGAGGVVSSIFSGDMPFEGIGKLIGDGIGASTKMQTGVGDAISGGFGNILGIFGDLFSAGGGIGKLLGGIGLGGAGTAISSAASGLAAGGAGAGAIAGSIVPGLGTAIGAGVGMLFSTIAPKIIEGFSKVFETVKTVFMAVVGTVFSVVKGAGEAFNSVITSVVGDRTKVIFGELFNPLVLGIAAVVVVLAPLAAMVGAVLLPGLMIAAVSFFVIGAIILATLPVWILLGIVLVAVAGALGIIAGLLVAAIASLLSTIVAVLAAVAVFILLALAVSGILIPVLMFGLALLALAAVAMIVVGIFVALAAAQVGMLLAFAGLVKETESFKDFQLGFEAVIDRLVEAVEPFFEHLVPLIGLFDAFVSVLIPMFSSMANIEGIAKTVFSVFKGLAIAAAALFIALGFVQTGFLAIVSGLSMTLAFVIEGLVTFASWIGTIPDLFVGAMKSAAASILNFFGLTDFAGVLQTQAAEAFQRADDNIASGSNAVSNSLRSISDQAVSLMPDLEGMQGAFGDLMSLTFEEARVRGEDLISRKKANEEFNEGLSNAPEGFKVALARFRAIDPSAGAPLPGSPLGDSNGTNSTQQFFIDKLNVLANTPQELVEKLNDANEQALMQSTGSPSGGAGQFNNGNQ